MRGRLQHRGAQDTLAVRPRRRQRVQDRADLVLGREALGAEPVPDGPVLRPGQQHHLGPLHAAAGPPHLLVVGHRRVRRADVDDEGQVGLVEAHAQRAGRHQRLDPVGLEVLLQPLALGRLRPARVGGHVEPGLAQALGDLEGGAHGEAVDDARARRGAQVAGQPGQAGRRVGQEEGAQVERVALQGAAQDEDLGGPLARGAPGQLLGDVVGHPLVRRGGGGQDGRARGQLGQQGADAPVVGAEVVPPVGDAVRLVDDDEPGAGRQVGQDLVAEDRVVEALGGHQQDIDVPGAHLRLDLVPLGGVGRVDGDGVDAGAPGGGDLVAHEGQQRGDDDARPGAGARAGGGGRGAVGPRAPALAQQDGGHEVDGGLAPAGALNHQRPAPADDQGLDGAPLVLAQRRVLAPHQRAQD